MTDTPRTPLSIVPKAQLDPIDQAIKLYGDRLVVAQGDVVRCLKDLAASFVSRCDDLDSMDSLSVHVIRANIRELEALLQTYEKARASVASLGVALRIRDPQVDGGAGADV